MVHDKTPILEVQNLRKRFGGLIALNGVDLTVHRGEFHSVIGPNGAGKTTLFNSLAGMFPPTGGRIFFKNRDVTRMQPFELFRLNMVRTFQISSIFANLTVLKNLEIAAQGRHRTSNSPWGRLTRPRGEITKTCVDCLQRYGLEEMMNQTAGLLAYGDKRRLEIAMGVVGEPEIFLIDEPTAGMSPEETAQTVKLLRRLSDEMTILLVEHDMSVVMEVSDRITVLNQGTVLAQGTPREIRRNPEVRSVYLGEYSC